MRQRTSRHWGAFAAAGGAAAVVLVLIVATLSREAAQVAPLPSTSTPTTDNDPAVAVVNGDPIGLDDWEEAMLVDQALSGLAGVEPASSPEAKLEELINQALVTQGAPQEVPTAQEVEARIAALEKDWGVGDDAVVAALVAVGLDREALVGELTRLLTVERAQEALVEAEGLSIEEWLVRARDEAQITIYRQRMQAVLPTPLASALPTPLPATPWSPLPTATPAPRPRSVVLTATDFTLGRAGGGTFTLSDQASQGSVVLVFFQRCG